MKKIFSIILLLAIFLLPQIADAHLVNQSYIFLRVYENSGIEGRFEMNAREINKVFGLNLSNDFAEEDVAPYIDDIKAYLLKNSAFSSSLGNHKIILKKDIDVQSVYLGNFLKIFFVLENTETLPDELTVDYSAVFEKDDTHRGYLITEYNWKAGVINDEMNISLEFAPGDTQDTMSLTDVSVWKGFVAMVKQGVWHIWIGIDHILFLIALILPSVVRRREDATGYSLSNWEAVKKFKPAFYYILKVITFFTIAHTITLTLASLEIVNMPSRIAESIIAFSIGLAAFHNIRPIFKGRDWVIAFVFGLFHGFGFASVLGDLGLTNEFLTFSLLGFNVGVELGQLLIIALVFPILYLLRNRKIYNKILVYGSVILIIVSVYWCIERIFDIEFGVYNAVKLQIREWAIDLGLWTDKLEGY